MESHSLMQPQKQPKLSIHVERWSDVQLQTFFMLPKIKKRFSSTSVLSMKLRPQALSLANKNEKLIWPPKRERKGKKRMMEVVRWEMGLRPVRCNVLVSGRNISVWCVGLTRIQPPLSRAPLSTLFSLISGLSCFIRSSKFTAPHVSPTRPPPICALPPIRLSCLY